MNIPSDSPLYSPLRTVYKIKPASERDGFLHVRSEWDNLQQQVSEKNRELENLLKTKEEMDLLLANSTLKQQAMSLNDKLQELGKKRNMQQELDIGQAGPEQGQESFIEKIRMDNAEIEEMQHL